MPQASGNNPWAQALDESGLSDGEAARRSGLTKGFLSLCRRGVRRMPPGAFTLLALDRAGEREKEYTKWWAERRRSRREDAFAIEVKLPPGVSAKQARAACLGAIGRLAEAAKP